jgi:V/A-type H+-transporting ATPase subunit I
MMGLSIAVGCAHLALAHALGAWHRRRSVRALASLGWIAIIAGAFVWWLGASASPDWTTVEIAAQGAIGCGALCVLLFSSRRGLHRPRDAVRLLLDGLLALTGLSRAFGDVLSYLRLFALGLASAYLAITFNRLAVEIHNSVPGVGLLLSALVLLLGHLLNFALAVASGIVHGLRLNLIEFLNWSLQGDGYPFRAFEKKEKRAWTAQ